MDPLVSIITINYNQLRYTLELLNSLTQSAYRNIEIIVVDNASTENPTSQIKEQFPNVQVIVSDKNLGFAGGNNLGIRAAKGKYLFFLNNDTEIVPDSIRPLVDFCEQHADAGIVCPKILFYNSGETIQYVGSSRINAFTGRNERPGFGEVDRGQFNAAEKTDLPHGAAMMVPRSVIDATGLMPEIFFLYYEELDWAETIKKMGYNIYVVPDARIYHKESMSVGKNSTLKTYYMTRNRLLFMRRHTKGLSKLSSITFFLIFSIPKNTLSYLIKGEMKHVSAFWRGFLWNVTHPSGKTN